VDVQKTLAVLGAIATVVTIIGGIYKSWQIGVMGFWEKLKARVARAYWRVPKTTLIVLPDHETRLWWHMGGVSGKPAMQIVGDFYFTNITSEPILVTKTFILAYTWKCGFIPFPKRVEGHVFVQHAERDVSGPYHILPRHTSKGMANWWIQPPIKKEGQTLRARTCFIDHFGNEHWLPALTWRYS
jgi:hypothetical protein